MKSRTWMWMTVASLLFAALAIPAQARVVYTPVNVTLPTNSYYPIDLNHDGITDFKFYLFSGHVICPPPVEHSYLVYLTVQPTSGGGGIVGGFYAAALQSGVQIDSHQGFYQSIAHMYSVILGGCNYHAGQWYRIPQRYLGLEFQINGQTHYGWAKLSTNNGNFLYGFAYETIPGMAIKTGQMFDSPDEPGIGPDSAEPEDSGPTASVAPPLSAAPQLQSSATASAPIPVGMAAQDSPWQDHKPRHHQYRLIDMGTFGGPASYTSNAGPGTPFLNNQGMVAGYADTSTSDPYFPNCTNPDCFVSHTSRWDDGVLTDLGALPGGYNSTAGGINARGWITGNSQNGAIDPLTGFPEGQAVLWADGKVIDLGTLGGGYESFGTEVNNRGQVTGFAGNLIPDPFFGTQIRVFLWEKGVMRDLGTLGGPDSPPFGNTVINESGQVAGCSFTSSTPNQNTGIPTADPFLWERGQMRDLGTLGGTIGYPFDLNNQGQVVGLSDLPGDQTSHPFLWDLRKGLTDLGTLGGDNGEAVWINDAGDVVGEADLPGSQAHDAFLWRRGVMTDLGNLGLTSFALAINSGGQIVGHSKISDGTFRAFLWESPGPMIDLNTLIPSNSSLLLTDAQDINERGEIGGLGVPAGCQPADVETCGHAFLLIPDGDCDSNCEGRIAQSQSSIATSRNIAALTQNPAVMKQGSESLSSPVERLRSQMRQRYHLPGQPAASRN